MLFTTSQVGYYCIYSFHQYRLRREMKEMLLAGIPDSSLHVIEARPDDPSIIWEEEGKEFILDGELYDVARIKEHDGKTFIYCIRDDKEKTLLHHYAKAIKSQSDHSNRKGKQIKLQITDYFVNETERTSCLFPDKLQQYEIFNVHISSIIKEVHAPPPRSYAFILA